MLPPIRKPISIPKNKKPYLLLDFFFIYRGQNDAKYLINDFNKK
jgi:hypothetical protein